jgi:hypothetical protein
VVITNYGTGVQQDNPGDEFSETFPAGIHLVSAAATSGIAVINGGSVTWNGSVPAGNAVTIGITATIDQSASVGQVFSTQGQISFDADLNGTNETTGLTYAPPLLESEEPTVFTVRNYSHAAYVAGKKASSLAGLGNDVSVGSNLSVVSVTRGQFGNVTFNADGTLSYTSGNNLPPGEDTFTYTANDGHGGTYMANVTVRDLREAAGHFTGLVQPSVGMTAQFERLGIVHATITPTGTVTGSLTIAGARFPFTGVVDSLGNVLFGRTKSRGFAVKHDGIPDLQFGLMIVPNAGLDQISGTLTQDDNSVFAEVTADRAIYNAKTNPAPTQLRGKYTALFRGKSTVNNGVDVDHFPHGSGIGTVTITAGGSVSLKGTLADGSPISFSDSLTKGDLLPFYVRLYKGTGAIGGVVHCGSRGSTDIDGLSLPWFRPANATSQQYPDGWPGAGITADLIGSKFVGAQRGVHASILPGLGSVNSVGNAMANLDGGDLDSAINVSANVDIHNKVTFVSPPKGLNLKLTIAPTGLISGSFIHPVSKRLTAIKSVIFQNEQVAEGFFLGPDQSGKVTLEPK